MPEQSAYRIMLLPQIDYWGWVGAAKDYAVRFQTTLTPTPQNAARFHFPKQVISVVVTPDGYPQFGDIVAWLRTEIPIVKLDILETAFPADLESILNERISRNDVKWLPPRLPSLEDAPPSASPEDVSISDESQLPLEVIAETEIPLPLLQLLWPTDYPDILQGFGDNPDMYLRFGYPGHEGIDIKAPLNTNIYACAAGEVYHVDDGTTGHPYGIHVCIRHANGYATTYAHLNQALVYRGQEVGAGEQIGVANSTGNATVSHLHLSLTQSGATDAGLTIFPHDIIDPTPYLTSGPQQAPIGNRTEAWSQSGCLFGLNATIGLMQPNIDNLVSKSGFGAIKIDGRLAEEVDQLFTLNPNLLVVAQLRSDLAYQIVTPENFAAIVRDDLQQLYDRGVRYFELHNEPNLSVEGFGTSWSSGSEFGNWFLSVAALLRQDFSEAQFGWPGLSPGPTEGMRFDYRIFLESAYGALAQADWIGCQCYWQSTESMYAIDGGLSYRYYRDLLPDKLLLITDFANLSPSQDSAEKAQQYQEYLALLRSYSGVAAAFLSLAHASSEIGLLYLNSSG